VIESPATAAGLFFGQSGEQVFDSMRSMPRCDFCGSRMVRWSYPAEREWLACEKCHRAIAADDREALLDRATLIPVPRTLPERYAPKYLERARRLHHEFWETRSGKPSAVR
jgi:hypothetical protein